MNIPALVDRAAAHYSHRVAIECGDQSRTFAEVRDHANRLAHFLLTACGDGNHRLAIILPNCVEYAEVELGVAKAGAASVQLSPALTAMELARILRDADVSAVIFGAKVLPTMDQVRSQLTEPCIYVCVGARTSWSVEYGDCLAGATSEASPAASWGEERLYRLAYTSATTGIAKGVELSTGAVMAVARNILSEFRPSRPRDRLLHLAPLCHGTGMFILPWFLIGGTSVIHTRFDAERVLASAHEDGIGTIKAVPTMLVRMLECGETRFRQLKGIDQVIYGGSPMPVEPMKHALDLAGQVFAQLYGQSEAPMTITVLQREDHLAGGDGSASLLKSAGRPWTCVDVAVLGDNGSRLAPGEAGEVAVRGDFVMDGYWRNKAETARTLVDGWVRTRDIGVLDERGYLFLLDRKNDLIISGGMNVYPREVEDALHAHAGVLEAAVFGVPDQRWGEAVVAVVAPKADAVIDKGDLLSLCKVRLAGYKVPKEIRVVREVPKNAIGKISRKLVRDRLSELVDLGPGSS